MFLDGETSILSSTIHIDEHTHNDQLVFKMEHRTDVGPLLVYVDIPLKKHLR